MTPLEEIRHSASHILAAAVLRLFPETKLDIGPPTDTGFYYDFDLEHRFTQEDLEKLETEMRKIVKEDQPFTHEEVSRESARALFEKLNQPYKLSRLEDIPEGEAVGLYRNGDFVDLCGGTHAASTGKVKAFKLLSIAGAYHRGDEKNKQLQRIYGTAFPSQAELDAHLAKLEEAKKRDHKKLGSEMGLFLLSPEVGSGLPILLPKGAVLRQELEKLIREKLAQLDYQWVYSPHIASLDLYKTSGHYPYYAESMYDPISIDERAFLVKPMNCPMHIHSYLSDLRSYRDLPLRYAEFGTVYRREQSGEINGLVRVRMITQDDGHIFCMPEQLKDEFKNCVALIQDVMGVFGLKTRCRISLRSEDESHEKYVGAPEAWEQAQKVIGEVVEELGLEHSVGLGEAAFYGPKLDFVATDVLDREWQLATIQVDYNLPDRFQLEFVGADGNRHQPVMIHRAVFGSIERFLGLLIEHFAGKFPVWLAPEQIRFLPISDDQIAHAESLREQCKALGLRSSVDCHADKIGAKIRRAQLEKVPYMLIIGKKEAAEGTVSVRSRDKGDEGAMAFEPFLQRVQEEVSGRVL